MQPGHIMTGLAVKLTQQRPIPLDVDLRCAADELIALVGPSGSGKSTVLRTIAGIFKPEESTVTINNQIWCSTSENIHVKAHNRAAGMVFQQYALFPHMTVAQNITSSIPSSNHIDISARVTDLLEKVNLSGLQDRYPNQLSGGQQQRVAVARALARDPEVLLLDEPFSSVDRLTRRRLYREIVRLRKELSIPVVLVTHDLDEAATLADRMYVLHHGKTLQSGTPDEVVSKPVSAEVARLVDLRNLFTATVTHHDARKSTLTLLWSGVKLTACSATEFSVGKEVQWVIPDGSVMINRTDRQSVGDRPNKIDCQVDDILFSGQLAQLTLVPTHRVDHPLHASLPARVIRNNAIHAGMQITVSLDPQSIHVMS